MSKLDLSRREILEGAGMLVVGFAIGGAGFTAAADGAEAVVRSVAPEAAPLRSTPAASISERAPKRFSPSSSRMNSMCRSGRSVWSWVTPG